MNTTDDYFDGDMSDDEYRERIQRERERDEFYARVAAAAKLHSDGGYRESTQERVSEFARNRNECHCHACQPIDFTKPQTVFMRQCPYCGNKRCPKATNHRNECTNSNDPDQTHETDPWNDWKANKDIV